MDLAADKSICRFIKLQDNAYSIWQSASHLAGEQRAISERIIRTWSRGQPVHVWLGC